MKGAVLEANTPTLFEQHREPSKEQQKPGSEPLQSPKAQAIAAGTSGTRAKAPEHQQVEPLE